MIAYDVYSYRFFPRERDEGERYEANVPQKEEELLAKVAVGHDANDGNQLLQMPGWQTLMTILRESGENAPTKRVFDSSPKYFGSSRGSGEDGGGGGKRGSNDRGLAKRLRGVSLK